MLFEEIRQDIAHRCCERLKEVLKQAEDQDEFQYEQTLQAKLRQG